MIKICNCGGIIKRMGVHPVVVNGKTLYQDTKYVDAENRPIAKFECQSCGKQTTQRLRVSKKGQVMNVLLNVISIPGGCKQALIPDNLLKAYNLDKMNGVFINEADEDSDAFDSIHELYWRLGLEDSRPTIGPDGFPAEKQNLQVKIIDPQAVKGDLKYCILFQLPAQVGRIVTIGWYT